jgi:hypothetical protein
MSRGTGLRLGPVPLYPNPRRDYKKEVNMYRYNAKLRLSGSVLNEVRCRNVCAAEIILLRKLHGDDAVVDIVELKNDSSQHAVERAKLKAKYAPDRIVEHRSRVRFEQLFGPEHTRLPDRLPSFEPVEEEAPLKGKKLKNTGMPAAVVAAEQVDMSAIAG